MKVYCFCVLWFPQEIDSECVGVIMYIHVQYHCTCVLIKSVQILKYNNYLCDSQVNHNFCDRKFWPIS